VIVRVDQYRAVFYTVEGTGPEILFLHGAASDSDTLAPLVSELSGSHRCIALDRLGYPRSTRLNENTSVEEQATAVAAVLDEAASGPLWVFGHSSGGIVALGYASLFPDRVRGLVLMEPAVYALYPDDATPPPLKKMKEEIVPLFQGGDIAGGIKRFMDHLELSHDTKVELARTPSEKGIDNWLPLRNELDFALRWPRPGSDLLGLIHPTLVLKGGQTTPLLAGASEILADVLPNARLSTLDQCDHLAPLMKPSLVAEQIASFIRAHAD
jgi:pimeloyl-ACP methyl ester carboxylesterase